MNRSIVLGASLLAVAGASPAVPEPGSVGVGVDSGFAARCAALPVEMEGGWPDGSTRILASIFHASGTGFSLPGRPGRPSVAISLPAHCEVTVVTRERTGVDGKPYAINLRVRLPEDWNGRFLMQGGGGTNGTVGDAIGMVGMGQPNALERGFAVMAQDSGHDNAKNFDPARGGVSAFGFDPEARAQYGGTSLPLSTAAARALVRAIYGKAPDFSYFMGCSKGGQEGMMLAQRYPGLYDGIVAGAPGFSLPRAAIAEAWNTQAIAGAVQTAARNGEAAFTPMTLAQSFTQPQLGLVREAVLDACDGADGARDGIVANYRACTSSKVLPQLNKRLCAPGQAGECLTRPQVDALVRIHTGARDSKGRQLYAGFPWDAGWSDMGWRIWMMGTPDGQVPALNVAMGASALSTIFSVPPRPIGPTPQDGLNFAMSYDFDRDAPGIYRTDRQFSRSGWQDIGARSTDLSAFRARHGKLIVPHGLSDPVFSVNDTMAWWDEVDRKNHGRAASFVRVFPVPGMGHCQGGPATDTYDTLTALIDWVEHGKAPESLAAQAGPGSPWPGRKRPLCRYPTIARTVDDHKGGEITKCVARGRTY